MNAIRRLIEASSLGTPDAVALRERGGRALSGRLTGMAEEQADWESGTCVTCDLTETRWNPFDPLYISGGSQCPDCNRHDLNEEATRKHAEVNA